MPGSTLAADIEMTYSLVGQISFKYTS